MRSILSSFVIALSLAGCGQAELDSAAAEKLHYTDAEEQRRLKVALENAHIPFEVHNDADGREEIWYESRFVARVKQIRDDLFGVPPPMGRSISLGTERNSLFVEELNKRNATYWTVTYHDADYIAWSPESDEAADVALQAVSGSSDGFVELKKMRKAADAEQNHSSQPREEPAPTER